MAKGYVDTLKELRDGDLGTELSAKLAELVEAVRATEKTGTLTLKLTLRPMKKGHNMMMLDDDIKLVKPEPDKETSTFLFATDANELTRRDPRQPELPGVRGVVTSMPHQAERAEQSNG